MRWNDPIHIPRPLAVVFVCSIAVVLFFAASQITTNWTDLAFYFLFWAGFVFFVALALAAVYLNLRSTGSPRARGIVLSAVLSGFVALSVLNMSYVVERQRNLLERYEQQVLQSSDCTHLPLPVDSAPFSESDYLAGRALVVELLLMFTTTIACLWVFRWPPMEDWKATEAVSAGLPRSEPVDAHLDSPIAIGRNRVSAGMNTSRLVEAGGKISSIQIDRDILMDIPVAPVASLFSILFIIVGAMQIFPSAPPGFQKELLPNVIQPHQIRVTVASTGQVTIDGVPTSRSAIYDDMAFVVDAHRERGESRHIALDADFNASWDGVITVLDAARQAGDDDVTFAFDAQTIRH